MLYAPIDIACRKCAAQPKENCVGYPDGHYHAERVEDAFSISTTASPVEETEFDEAVANRLF